LNRRCDGIRLVWGLRVGLCLRLVLFVRYIWWWNVSLSRWRTRLIICWTVAVRRRRAMDRVSSGLRLLVVHRIVWLTLTGMSSVVVVAFPRGGSVVMWTVWFRIVKIFFINCMYWRWGEVVYSGRRTSISVIAIGRGSLVGLVATIQVAASLVSLGTPARRRGMSNISLLIAAFFCLAL
jgi:hypothetical protein